MASQPQRAEVQDRAPIAGEAFLRALADHGIDYFFANPGTDFAAGGRGLQPRQAVERQGADAPGHSA